MSSRTGEHPYDGFMKKTKPTTLQDYRQRMQKVLAYLQEHVEESVALDEVAAVAAFSPYHFHRIFKRVYRHVQARHHEVSAIPNL